MVFLYNAWGDIFKVKVSAGAKVGAKVRAFGAAKVGVNADIGSANQEWIYGSGGWHSKSYGSQRISAELDVVGNGGNLSYGRTHPFGGNDWSKTSFDKNLNIKGFNIDGTFGLEATILIGGGFEIDFSEIPNFLQDKFGW
jgi:hypothetical protein